MAAKCRAEPTADCTRDTPLAYQAFLGGQYGTDGAQVKWLAPTDQFLEFGAEIGNGDSFPGSTRNRNGVGAFDAFAHTGGDIGASRFSAWPYRYSMRVRASVKRIAVIAVDPYPG